MAVFPLLSFMRPALGRAYLKLAHRLAQPRHKIASEEAQLFALLAIVSAISLLVNIAIALIPK